jgi:hypothetical protein
VRGDYPIQHCSFNEKTHGKRYIRLNGTRTPKLEL